MQTDRDAVHAEARVFSKYLADVDASAYVLETYSRLLPTADVSPAMQARPIERWQLIIARWGVAPLRVADSYARFFLPRSLLRRRLVLMLSILENSAGSERPLNSAYEGSLFAVILRLAVIGVVSVSCVLLGLLLLGPVHLLSGVGERRSGPVH